MSDRKKSGVTPPVQMRLGEETLAIIDAVVKHYGLSSRTEAVRLLAQEWHRSKKAKK